MKNRIKNLFDMDYTTMHDITLKYGLICIISSCLLLIIFLLIQKDYTYSNTISFLDEKKAYLVVDQKHVNDITSNHIVMIDNINCEYEVVKIEEKEGFYLVEIQFKKESKFLNTDKYSIKLKNESMIRYILRIMKGE